MHVWRRLRRGPLVNGIVNNAVF